MYQGQSSSKVNNVIVNVTGNTIAKSTDINKIGNEIVKKIKSAGVK
jgi:hypothetical protein